MENLLGEHGEVIVSGIISVTAIIVAMMLIGTMSYIDEGIICQLVGI